ncbi:uncharacterized protein SCHCODRAFT_02115762, partial [Schizophyllum commune H4-8]|uniref:uncharacterized protein n=1 Tax=Schizophyllum commune (strain H4-8 / FGSC 9210) TaxID=578458 RepID=UPI00216109DB
PPASRILRPSPSPPVPSTTASSSPRDHLFISNARTRQRNEIFENVLNDTAAASRRDLSLRHLSPITPRTHDGSRHVPDTPPKHSRRRTWCRSAGNASSLIVTEGRNKMYAYPTRISMVSRHLGGNT